MQLKNEKYTGQANAVVTGFGTLSFDGHGIVNNPKLSEEAMKLLAEVKGFELIESKDTEKPSKEEKKEEVSKPKEEEKESEKEAEEAKTKRSRRKKTEEK